MGGAICRKLRLKPGLFSSFSGLGTRLSLGVVSLGEVLLVKHVGVWLSTKSGKEKCYGRINLSNLH